VRRGKGTRDGSRGNISWTEWGKRKKGIAAIAAGRWDYDWILLNKKKGGAISALRKGKAIGKGELRASWSIDDPTGVRRL